MIYRDLSATVQYWQPTKNSFRNFGNVQNSGKSFLLGSPLRFLQPTVTRALDVLINDDLPDGTVADEAGAWVLDGRNMAFHGGLDGGIFKSQISVSAHCAVLKYEVVAVAQRLGLGDVAAD